MKSLVCAAGFILLMVPATSYAQQQQQRQGQGAANSAKAQQCRMDVNSRMRNVGGRSGGGNPGARQAEGRMLFQQCMAR
jgi:hypothetical protein